MPAAPSLAAVAAPEDARAGTALLVATRGDGAVRSARFDDLPRLLGAGDLLLVNTSATLPAALPGRLRGRDVILHLSTRLCDGSWSVELRTSGRERMEMAPVSGRVDLPGGAHAELAGAYRGSPRLRVARLRAPGPLPGYLRLHGRPIRYSHDPGARPLADYQTVFARHPGSAEMPSAARPFTDRLVGELAAARVRIAPLLLHTGVSSPETGEPPYPERYRVPAATARAVNAVHRQGGRVIAVGTTAVRALETVADLDGTVSPGAGWTDLVIEPERGLRAVDGLLTGWHEPRSSHLRLLEAAAGPELLARSYAAAHARGYRWHEFGDSHLILP